MAKPELTRNVFQKEYPTLCKHIKDLSAMTKTELQERDELYNNHWCKPGDSTPYLIMWSGHRIPKYVSTFAILSCSSRTADDTKRFCMKFNGDQGCDLQKCVDGQGFRHKCLFCAQDFPSSVPSHRCKVRRLFEEELARFKGTYRVDPFDENARGLGKDDKNMEATLKRLAFDPPKKKQNAETSSAASSATSFAALQDSESETEFSEGPVSAEIVIQEEEEEQEEQEDEAVIEEVPVEVEVTEEVHDATHEVPEAQAAEAEVTEGAHHAQMSQGVPEAAGPENTDLPKQETSEKEEQKGKEETKTAKTHQGHETEDSSAWTKYTTKKASKEASPGSEVKQHLLGFVCEMGDALEDCQGKLVYSPVKHQEVMRKATSILGFGQNSLRPWLLSRGLTVVCPSSGELPNKFATQLLHALDPQKRWVMVHGNALFVASKDGKQTGAIDPDWSYLSKMLEEDNSRFEEWFKEKSRGFQQGMPSGPGAMLFVPVDPCKAVQWEEVECFGVEAISKKAREVFAAKESCFPVQKSFYAESSSEDESEYPSRNVCDAFHEVKLWCSFAPNKITAAACKPEIARPDMRYQMNKRAALLIGKLYGLNVLKKHYLKRLRGDVILFLQVHPNDPMKQQPVAKAQWSNHWQEFTSKAPEELSQFLETANMDENEADKEIEAQVCLEEMKGWSKQWLDYADKYKKSLEVLEELAQPEDWKERLTDSISERSESKLPYLESYLQFKFAFSLHQSHETGSERGIHLTSDGKTLNFATGLLTRKHLRPIIGIYECRSPQDGQDLKTPPKFDARYKFLRWDFAAQGTCKEVEPLDLLTDECMTPGAQRNHLQLHELKSFNPYAMVEKNRGCLDHIASKIDRFESDNLLNGFSGPKGWDLHDEETRKEQVIKQLDKVCAWCRTDRSIPVMTVFGDFSYQWLLPLPNPSQDDSKLSESPTLVAVLQPQRKDKKDDPCYIFLTVLSLDMALQQARLCGKLHQRWTVSRRQAEELQKVVDAVKRIKEIPSASEEVKKGVRDALTSLKDFKECITRFLPSLATVETPKDGCSTSRARGSARPRSRSIGAESNPSEKEERKERNWETIGEARRSRDTRDTDTDPWQSRPDPWMASRQ